jgi:hypothetical protein
MDKEDNRAICSVCLEPTEQRGGKPLYSPGCCGSWLHLECAYAMVKSFSCSRKCPLCRAGIALPLIYTKFGIKSDNEPIVGRAPTNVSTPPTSAPLGVYPVAQDPPRRAPPVQVTPRTSPSVHVTPIISTPVPAPSLASAAAATDQRQAPSLRGIYFTVAVPANRATTTPTSQAATEVTPSGRVPNAADPNSHAANGHTNRTSSATYACGPSPRIVTGRRCSETKSIDYEADTTRGHYYRCRPALAARLVAAATTASSEAARCAGARRPLQPPPVVRSPTLPIWLLTEDSSASRTTAGSPRSAEKRRSRCSEQLTRYLSPLRLLCITDFRATTTT